MKNKKDKIEQNNLDELETVTIDDFKESKQLKL